MLFPSGHIHSDGTGRSQSAALHVARDDAAGHTSPLQLQLPFENRTHGPRPPIWTPSEQSSVGYSGAVVGQSWRGHSGPAVGNAAEGPAPPADGVKVGAPGGGFANPPLATALSLCAIGGGNPGRGGCGDGLGAPPE
jgi:hypothetical protein